MSSRCYRAAKRTIGAALALAASMLSSNAVGAEEQTTVCLENDCVKIAVGADGRVSAFVDKKTGADYIDKKAPPPLARVKIGTKQIAATSAERQGDAFKLTFGQTSVTAVLKCASHKQHLVIEVVALDGKDVESFDFVDIPLTLKGAPGEPFTACAMALSLKTNVTSIPQPTGRLHATCYRRFGFASARVAIVACPQGQMRAIMKAVVRAADEIPYTAGGKARADVIPGGKPGTDFTPVGGPWALDAEINKGSYLFNFGDMSEQTVGDWIELAQTLGISQIDFHGGGSFRFGDCRPNPKTYPKGFASLKAVIDRLHAAGIKAGLHTYAFFINKGCPWVTPKPDPRLAKDATFTLSGPLPADAKTVPVTESTEKMSTTTGFFVRNSVTLRIDDELITYADIAKAPPYAFTKCTRGALGTKAAAHQAGAKVHHLKECFGLFLPDGDSTLLTEVAAKTAEAFNTCGFDMIYMDALDGEDTLGGGPNGWHYGSKFVFEVCKRLARPAVMEMSTFHHHLWYVRARMGAWDHPTRSHKKFIDIHCGANAGLRRMFLPGHLGWWAVKTWMGARGEPTFADDIEYLCGKCIGTDVGFSVMGVSPASIKTVPAFARLGGIMRRYEDLRHKNAFDESVKAKLREPGKEFTLFQDGDGRRRFRRMHYAKHKVERVDGQRNVWSTANPFGPQPVRLRIEALMSAAPYDAPGNVTVIDWSDTKRFAQRSAAKGVTFALAPTTKQVKTGKTSGLLTASSAGQVGRKATWARAGATFAPVLDLSKHEALGLWVHGDGKGEVVNVQLGSPHHISHAIGDHYVIVDFTGWRYCELIEAEGERHANYGWPYGGGYAIYRESVSYRHVESLRILCNDIPKSDGVTCALSPIKAMPLVPITLVNPAVTLAGKRITFPVEIKSGCYLEFNATSDCTLYGTKGEVIAKVIPKGEAPALQSGANKVTFTCDGPTDVSARTRVTVISQGESI